MNVFKATIVLNFLMLMGCQQILAQIASVWISGEASVNINETYPYDAVFKNSIGQAVQPPGSLYSNWYVFGSYTLVSSSDYACQVKWTGAGTYSIEYEIQTWDNYYSDVLTVTVTDPIPPAPTVAEATNITTSSFTANWSTVPGATSYRLDVSTDINFSTILSTYSNVTVTNKDVSGLAAGVKYYYRVRAVKPSGVSLNSGTQFVQTSGLDLGMNYIRSIDVTVQGKTTPAQVESATLNERLVRYDFFDGLGRRVQSVLMQSSTLQNDVVQPIVYDAVGRESKKYLPYADDATSWYKPDALKDPTTTETVEPAIYRSGKQYAFYQPGGVLANDQFPYAETIFEPSPLNRVIKQGAPGEAWQPNAVPALDRSIKKEYGSNQEDEVILFNYDEVTARISFTENGALKYYDPNQLYANKTIDEHNNEVIEYTDKEGKTILKKVQYKEENGVKSYAKTYYIYDDFGNLVTVLPPEAVEAINATLD
jgi:hypothetical protein